MGIFEILNGLSSKYGEIFGIITLALAGIGYLLF